MGVVSYSCTVCPECKKVIEVTDVRRKECDCGWVYKKVSMRHSPRVGEYNPPNRPIFESMYTED
jgi:hypothetical protein